MPHLFYPADNLTGLRLLSQREIRADLVYIDPPFSTNNQFLLDNDRANSISASGRLAYADTTRGPDYLDALRLRLLAIRNVMSPTGSIYIHIGVNMEHHVRLLMDEVFGPQNFRNAIARIKCNPKNFARQSYGNMRDTILFYSASPGKITWNPQRTPLDEDDLKRLYPRVDPDGRRYATTPLHAPGVTRDGPTGQRWRGISPPRGRHWRYPPERLDKLDNAGLIHWSATGNPRKINYADQAEGKMPQDVWEYKDPQRPLYPTQKNAAMLERIILTSSNPGDTVMDCYAGGGGTLVEAARLGRRFIGMDDAPESHRVIRTRMNDIALAQRIRDDFTVFEPSYPEQRTFSQRPVSEPISIQ